MIEGLIGPPGSGKTFALTAMVLEAANSGRDVFTNFPVAHRNVYYFEPDQLLKLPPGLVAVDEAHLWFPARAALRLPMSWLQGMSQTRKHGWDMIWSTQHESRVDRVIRDITNWMWLCSAWGRFRGHPILFHAQSWEPHRFRSPLRKHKGVGRWRLYSRKIANAYDTMGIVSKASHTAQISDPYDTEVDA